MLSNVHFYHRITRKLVVAFGNMFNNIKLVRYNNAGTIEIERITVPLSYSTKEKFYTRITQDPSLAKEVQISLPRMYFEMTSITYDPLRKLTSFNKKFAPNNNTVLKSVSETPYNFEFNLGIYVRNTEDGTQIVEQILPYFNPDYTVTIDLVDSNPLKVDIPIILNSVNYDVSNDIGSGSQDDTRMLIWTLNFTAKGYMYGPIQDARIIRKVQANTYYDSTMTGEKRIIVSSGTGNYKVGEIVYEGRSLHAANATAYVSKWESLSNTVSLIDSSGAFEMGRDLVGEVSGARYTMTSKQNGPLQLTNLTVTPRPPTANIDEDFGFTETLEEYPNIV